MMEFPYSNLCQLLQLMILSKVEEKTLYWVNSIEFQVQSIYFIYARSMVHATLDLAYPKEYILAIKSTYSKYTI